MKLGAQERKHVAIVTVELTASGIADWSMRRTGRSHVLIEWERNGKRESILVSRGTGPTSQHKIRSDIRRRLSDRQPCSLRYN